MSIPLSNEDFGVEDGKLRLLRKGYFSVLIYSKTDPRAEQVRKLLSSLDVNQLHTAYLDISQGKNKEVILQSRKTSVPITDVPYLGFFVDGKLKARYKSNIEPNALKKYFTDKIVEAATSTEKISNPNIRKNETVQRAMNDQFSMSRPGGRSVGGSGLPTSGSLSSASSGTIPFNQAWKTDLVTKSNN